MNEVTKDVKNEVVHAVRLDSDRAVRAVALSMAREDLRGGAISAPARPTEVVERAGIYAAFIAESVMPEGAAAVEGSIEAPSSP